MSLSRPSTHRRLLACALSVGLMLAACGDTEQTATTDTEQTATTDEAPAPTPAGTTSPPGQAAEEEPAPTPAGRTVTITVVGGEPEGGIERIRVAQGETITLVVTSDAPGTVHVHGYDLTEEVTAGGQATLRFTADSAGVYEVEIEETHVVLAELEVR